jgi:hypothetical protein
MSTANSACNSLGYGWFFAGGSNLTINDGIVDTADTNGMYISPTGIMTNIIVKGNVFGTGINSSAIAVAPQGSASIDYCIFSLNVFHGAGSGLSIGASSCAHSISSNNL